MIPKKRSSINFIIYGICLLLVLFVALHAAVVHKNVLYMIKSGDIEKSSQVLTFLSLLSERIASKPFEIVITQYTQKFLLTSAFGWLIVVLMSESGKKNYIHGKEFGTARWGTISDIRDLFAENIMKAEIKRARQIKTRLGRWKVRSSLYKECERAGKLLEKEKLKALSDLEAARKRAGTYDKRLHVEEVQQIKAAIKEMVALSKRQAWKPDELKMDYESRLKEIAESPLYDEQERRVQEQKAKVEYESRLKDFFNTNQKVEKIKANVLIIDPENEYGDFCRAFGGTVLKISPTSDTYINPMDMSEDYGLDEEDDNATTPLKVKKDKALTKKSDYIMSIVERMISVGGSENTTSITPQQRTLVDQCVRAAYKEYLEHDFDPQYMPTLMDFQKELDKRKNESKDNADVADGVAYYTRGSMNVFSHHTNVHIENRLVVFNVRDLGQALRQIGLIIVFDFVWNRMVENKNKKIRTYCYCDEIHTMFKSYYSADYLNQLYKRGRKYGLVITGITQDVEDLLRSDKAKGMISNSDFIMMLNQSSENLKQLAKMLNISETQMGFVTGADAGSGLLFAEKVIVPFVDRFPEESYLYKLMSTKFDEDKSKDEIEREIAELMKEHTTDEPLSEREIEKRLQSIYSE